MDSDDVGGLGRDSVALYGIELAFGFTPMPREFLVVLAGVLFLYILAAEIAKKVFYQSVKF